MKTASADLIALLSGSNQYIMAETYTFTLADGTVVHYRFGDDAYNLPDRDPNWGDVISFLNFRTGVVLPAYPGGYPSTSTASLGANADLAPNGPPTWTLIGHEHADAAVVTRPYPGPIPRGYPAGDGYLYLPPYQAPPGTGFSNSCLKSGTISALSTIDDFTLEFTHNEQNDVIYRSIAFTMMVTGVASSTNGPDTTTEWGLINRYDSSAGARWLQFVVYSGLHTAAAQVSTDPATHPVPGGNVDRRICVMRKAGVLYLFIEGILYATQNLISFPANHQTLFPGITIGAVQDGAYYLPNNYGTGQYSRFRFTKMARYPITGYTPTSRPFPIG